jgi:hypothetical protein
VAREIVDAQRKRDNAQPQDELLTLIGDWRVVDELDQQPIWIVKIEGSSTISMRFRLGRERNSMRSNTLGPLVDVLRAANDETDVMDSLHGTRLDALRQLMESQVIVARSQIGIFRVGHPLQFHPEHGRIKLHRFGHTPNIQGDVPKTEENPVH